MTEIRTKWEKLPRSLRGATLIGLSSAVTASMFIAHEELRNTSETPTKSDISYAIGVVCAKETAKVSYRQSADTVKFRCTTSDGTTVDVMKIQNVDPDYISESTGYNDIVPIYTPGEAIDFDFDGPEAIATIYTTSVDKSAINDPTTGIARVGN